MIFCKLWQSAFLKQFQHWTVPSPAARSSRDADWSTKPITCSEEKTYKKLVLLLTVNTIWILLSILVLPLSPPDSLRVILVNWWTGKAPAVARRDKVTDRTSIWAIAGFTLWMKRRTTTGLNERSTSPDQWQTTQIELKSDISKRRNIKFSPQIASLSSYFQIMSTDDKTFVILFSLDTFIVCGGGK